MLIQACLNGSRAPGEHPGLPIHPAELADAVLRCIVAGAGALHIHPRATDGTQTLDPTAQAAAIVAIRARCPALPLGVSTAAWIEPDPARRLALIQHWRTLPDHASVNLAEAGAVDLCHALLARGIGVEAGLASADDVDRLHAAGLAAACLRVLVEPPEATAASALATAQQILAALDRHAIAVPRLLHGAEGAAWPVLDLAVRLGYDTRIGLEDTLLLPDARLAADNAELVAEAVRRIAASYMRASPTGSTSFVARHSCRQAKGGSSCSGWWGSASDSDDGPSGKSGVSSRKPFGQAP